MKCGLFFLFLLITVIMTQEIDQIAKPRRIKRNGSKWITSSIIFQQSSLKVVYHAKVDPRKISELIRIIDLSLRSKASGVSFQQDDVICISNKLLFWFSLSDKGRRQVRSGGGLLAGMWEIKNKANSELKLKRVDSKGYVKNLLYPGTTTGRGFFGADVYGGYIGSNIIWGLEHSINSRITKRFGKHILEYERGSFATDGVFIEFKGTLGNSGIGEGIESLTDTDPRPGVIGKTKYILTYRVPAHTEEIIQEVTLKAVKNNFGPINTAKVSLYLPGYEQYNMDYAANTELIKGGSINLNNVVINKYFKNSCEKTVYFYEVPYGNKQIKQTARTPEGRGTLACIGSPKNKVPFVCGYPTNDLIPRVAWEDFTIELYDNQSVPRYGRFHGINYNLFQSRHKQFTLSNTSSIPLILIMRYKVIPSFIDMTKKKIKK